MKRLSVVLFDVDGVLLDSLTPHLKRISPMKYFFTAVGFPDEFADKANVQYQQIFLKQYAPRPFLGMQEALAALRKDNFQLGIVTSNVKENVLGALGSSVGFFRKDCILSKDDMAGISKSQAIGKAVSNFQVNPDEVIYVGDQPADWEAAKAAGVRFLGVTYGWGISEEDKEFPTVKNISGIYSYIQGKYLPQLESQVAR